jgi:hypothetical protein
MADLLRTKVYPDNYTNRVASILKAMSFGSGLIVAGSASIRSQLYAGDYDGYEIVDTKYKSNESALKSLAVRFKGIIKKVKALDDVWIGDIKAGVWDEWRVIPKEGEWNVMDAVANVKRLRSINIISAEEEKEALMALWEATDKEGMLRAKDAIKFHVLRWTPREVLQGSKRLRDGRTIQLWEAMGTPGITKLDAIAWLGAGEGYTDFSVIYEFKNNGVVLNPAINNVLTSLNESLVINLYEGNYFKAIKRMYSIAKMEGNEARLAELTPVLNSDLGRMYQIVSDIETIVQLLDEHSGASVDDVRDEIDGFKNRLSNIYTMHGYIKAEPRILNEINRILILPLNQIKAPLTRLGSVLDEFLQKYSKPYTEGIPSV